MTMNKNRTPPTVLKLPEARLSYAFLATPKPKPKRPDGSTPPPRYECTMLLDPTAPAHKAAIDAVKIEAVRVAKEAFGDGINVGALTMTFGNGNKKAVVVSELDGSITVNPTYEAYKDRFYVSGSNDVQPLVASRQGELISPQHQQFPYSGCYANVKVTLYPWEFVENGMTKRGISVDLRSVQFVKDGEAFGGRARINPEEEFEALGDAPGAVDPLGDDPF